MLAKSKVKYIQSLGQKKHRDEERCFIAEGPKLVEELLMTKTAVLKEIFGTSAWINENRQLLNDVAFSEITEQELERISQFSTPNKVLAIVEQFDEGEVSNISAKIILALETIQDPGNLGTIIRIADWFGVEQIVCSTDCADRYNPKVVQATMGSIARVKIFYTDMAAWLDTQKNKNIYAATLGGQDITAMEKIIEGIILIGNESKGISKELLQVANTTITIPKKGNAESLNAAVATGIILSHVL